MSDKKRVDGRTFRYMQTEIGALITAVNRYQEAHGQKAVGPWFTWSQDQPFLRMGSLTDEEALQAADEALQDMCRKAGMEIESESKHWGVAWSSVNRDTVGRLTLHVKDQTASRRESGVKNALEQKAQTLARFIDIQAEAHKGDVHFIRDTLALSHAMQEPGTRIKGGGDLTETAHGNLARLIDNEMEGLGTQQQALFLGYLFRHSTAMQAHQRQQEKDRRADERERGLSGKAMFEMLFNSGLQP